MSKMEGEHKNYIMVFILTFLISFYITSVYQNYKIAQGFNLWYESVLENYHRNVNEQKEFNDCFLIEKTDEQVIYINEVMISEMKNVGAIGFFSDLTLRTPYVIRKKMIYTNQLTPCIGKAFMNYKSKLSNYRYNFEKENNMSFEDWNEDSWIKFLYFMEKYLPDPEDIEPPGELGFLKDLYARTLQRYKENMENKEISKALFDLELLRSIESTANKDIISYGIWSLKKEYIHLVTENLKFTIPLSLWLWIVYLITYSMLKKNNTYFSIRKMKKRYKTLLVALLITLLLFLIMFSSLCAFLIINDKKMIIIRTETLPSSETLETINETNDWRSVEDQILIIKYPEIERAIEERNIERIKEIFDEIDILEKEFWRHREEYLRSQIIGTLKETKNEDSGYTLLWPFTAKKIDGIYLVVIQKGILNPVIGEKDIENLEKKIRSEKEEILKLCKKGEVDRAKDILENMKTLRMTYWSNKQDYIERKIIEDLSVIII